MSDQNKEKVKTMGPYDYKGLQAEIGGLLHDAINVLSYNNKVITKSSLKSTVRNLKKVKEDLVEEFKNEYEYGEVK